MASSSAPVHPGRYLSVFLVLVIGLYLLVFLTGDKRAATKLGIDGTPGFVFLAPGVVELHQLRFQ